jgi:hypothetical protein
MEKEIGLRDVLALRELETEHHENTNLKAIAWVIGVVVILAIIVFWFRRSHDHHGHESRYDGSFKKEYGENCGTVKFLEKQVAGLEEKAYYTHGKLDKLFGEFAYFAKSTDKQLTALERRCYPSNYILGDYDDFVPRRGGGGCGDDRRHGNCNKKFVRQDTYTPNTQQVIVTEDCVC